MKLREWYVRRKLGEPVLRIGVDPKKIIFEMRDFKAQKKRIQLASNPLIPRFTRPLARSLIWELAPFELKETSIRRVPISQTPIYRMMLDVYENRNRLRSSRTYQEVVHCIEENGQFRHKNYVIQSRNDVEECIRKCFLDILLSMRMSGYIRNKRNSFSTGGIGSAFVDRDGSVLKAVGASHRLAAAHVVRFPGVFPFRVIGGHSRWLRNLEIRGPRDVARLAAGLRQVEIKNAPALPSPARGVPASG